MAHFLKKTISFADLDGSTTDAYNVRRSQHLMERRLWSRNAFKSDRNCKFEWFAIWPKAVANIINTFIGDFKTQQF